MPPAITREEGCGDTANVPPRVFHARSRVLKLRATARTVPSLQLPPFGEEKKKKKEVRASQESIPSSNLHGTWQVTPESQPLAAFPPAQHGRHGQREMKSQRLSFWCLTEHKNSALKTKKREKGDGESSRGGEGRRCTARRSQKHGRGGAGAHTALTHISISEEFPGKINAKSVIKVYLRVRERASAPDYGIEMSLFSCICLTQFYLVAFCTISCSFCC